jgi:hypothetical protein
VTWPSAITQSARRDVTSWRRQSELDALLDQAGTDAYRTAMAAMAAADAAVNAVLGSLHFNAILAPVLGQAAGRMLARRRR